MNSREKSDFAIKCRALRMSRFLKQREVALAISVKPATYGNMESSPFRVVRVERVMTLAKFYGLTGQERQDLLAAWERTPLSEYSERQRERWAKRNLLRSKGRNYDRMQLALVELVGLLLMVAPDPNTLCVCLFGGGTVDDPKRPCELCSALEVLGLDHFTTKNRAIEQLAKLQEKLEEAKAHVHD